MNDTHGEKGEGWYGFDLDGTLAKYDEWKGIGHIGEPIAPMVELMKKMHDEGKVVKIMTARVAPKEKPEVERNPFIGHLNPDYAKAYIKSQEEHPSGFYSLVNWGAREFVSDWCLKNLGFMPEIVHQKDHLMLELYDDRVKQVVPNEGILVEDFARKAHALANDVVRENAILTLRLNRKFNGFHAGFALAMLLTVLAVLGGAAYDRYFAKHKPVERKIEALHKAVCDFYEDIDRLEIRAK